MQYRENRSHQPDHYATIKIGCAPADAEWRSCRLASYWFTWAPVPINAMRRHIGLRRPCIFIPVSQTDHSLLDDLWFTATEMVHLPPNDNSPSPSPRADAWSLSFTPLIQTTKPRRFRKLPQTNLTDTDCLTRTCPKCDYHDIQKVFGKQKKRRFVKLYKTLCNSTCRTTLASAGNAATFVATLPADSRRHDGFGHNAVHDSGGEAFEVVGGGFDEGHVAGIAGRDAEFFEFGGGQVFERLLVRTFGDV